MLNIIKSFLKLPTTNVGIITALMFQVVFSVIWMTGYEGVMDANRLKNLQVGIVSLDKEIGPTIADQLANSLPVTTVELDSQEYASKLLNERKLHMVVTIPHYFSQLIQSSDSTAKLNYSINESNPQMIKSIMSSIANQITETVNKQSIKQGLESVLTEARLPIEQVDATSVALSERVTSEFNFTNIVNGQNKQMVPMMLVLASYVGAMLLSMNLETSSNTLTAKYSSFRRFGARTIINIVAAIFISLVGSVLVITLGGQTVHGFFTLWCFQTLFMLAFLFTSQLFLLLIGQAGMIFNIIMLSVQLVTSGAMLPRELLPELYQQVSLWLPATYAVEGIMNLLFGGPDVSSAVIRLVAIIIVTWLIGVTVVTLRKGKGASAQPGLSS